MRNLSVLFVFMLVSCSFVFCQSSFMLDRGNEIWDKTIAAKGGRAQLHKISNFLVVRRQTKLKQLPVNVGLFVLPDWYWSWWNSGGIFGTEVWVHGSTGTWRASEDIQGHGILWLPPSQKTGDELRDQVLFLMETKWFQPTILSLTEERLGRDKVDVVTVGVDQDRVKYYIDKKTSLVRRVSPLGKYGNVVLEAVDMMDYQPVQGIMMPSRTRSPEAGTYRLEFAFDVEYDPEIFNRKPAIEDGPEGWKPPKK